MSHCFHVWYAHPLPWDAESGQENWEQTRNSGVHEPRLVGCVERLNALLQAHDADMVWAEEPEVSEPCAVLALVPQAGSMNFVADAIAAAAREQGLCVLNPFDGSVWLPNGRVLRRMALAVVDPSEATPRAPAASAVDAATTTQTAEQDSVAQGLRGDAPLAAYLLARWAPLLRQAGFKVRSRPSSEHPWCVFTGKVLRVYPKTDWVLVEGFNFVKKHLRKSQDNPNGGIVTREAPMAASKLVVVTRGGKKTGKE